MKLHCVMDSNRISKVSTWIAKGIINLIKASFIPESSKGKGRWNCHLHEKADKVEGAAIDGQNHIEDLVWKKKAERNTPGADFCLLVCTGCQGCHGACDSHLWDCSS